MYELVHPWALVLLPLPLLMWLLPAYRESRDSVRVPFFDKLVELSEQRPRSGATILRRDRVQRFLVGFMWLCLVLAELAAQRTSDRLGLIVFGTAAYLQTPFTDDHTVWTQLLTETNIGMAGQSTVFGDAIVLAIKLFKESDSDNRVLIISTDGNDTGSTVPPIDAAKVAASYGIRIYTIAIGDPGSVGEDALNMETLERFSTVTGGQAFQALDLAELRKAYKTIGELEPQLYETISFRPRQSLHWLPVCAALRLYTLYHGIGTWRTWRSLRNSGSRHVA